MKDSKPMAIAQAVQQALAQVDGPITVDEFTQRVLAIRPSKAKKPGDSVRNQLRWQEWGHTIVYLDRQTILPLRMALQGARFRIAITREEATKGILFLDPAFKYFLHRDLAPENVRFTDAAGHLLDFRAVSLKQRGLGRRGPFTREIPALDLSAWFRLNRIRRDDSILVTVEDWESGHFRLEHEPARHRRREEIERKNRELAALLFDMLENAHDERLFAHQAIPTAYARLSDPRGYPGDHWADILERDPRMAADGIDIHYRDVLSPLERMLHPEKETTPAKVPFTRAQAQRVYRFKAAFRHQPGLWRCIEIEGGQTLLDFDEILRDAFQHDPLDHLSAFWKLVMRGRGNRFREIELGDANPFGEGNAADLHVAGLGLKPGDQLKYVYDFGDWIEHLITLEEIKEPEGGAKYPRIVARNKPHYEDCQSCQSKGRRVVATWICLDCSYRRQQEVLVCQDCLRAEHEDHHTEKIVY